MKILFVSAEVDPLAALPKSLKNLGHDVRLLLPKYPGLDENKFKLKKIADNLQVNLGKKIENASLWEGIFPETDVQVYFIGNDNYLQDASNLQAEQYIFYVRAIIRFLVKFGWQPHILHCVGWQTALLPTYLKVYYKENSFLGKIATLFGFLDVEDQGLFTLEELDLAELVSTSENRSVFINSGKFSFLKCGLQFADILATGSEWYAQQIQACEFGQGFEDLIRSRSGDLYGVLDGIDNLSWDPEHDSYLAKNYTSKNVRGRRNNKKRLEEIYHIAKGKKHLLAGIVLDRLKVPQEKNLSGWLEKLVEEKINCVVLISGPLSQYKIFVDLIDRYPQRIAVKLNSENQFEHLLFAGCDLFLVPFFQGSGYFKHRLALKYGALPFAAQNAGLADVIRNYDFETGKGEGFIAENNSPQALGKAIKQILTLFNDKRRLEKLQRKNMNSDFSWQKTALEYIPLYKKAVEKISG